MIHLRIRFYVSLSSGSLAVALKLKAKHRFHIAAFIFLAFYQKRKNKSLEELFAYSSFAIKSLLCMHRQGSKTIP
jgi:hypothetical protein